MARHEEDREDIMAEAVALKRRVEFQITGDDRFESIVAGFKRSGHFSIYFGQDPAYHFDANGKLRRAYRAGHLYRTQGTTLAQMRRERDDSKTTLVRIDLDATALNDFRDELSQHIQSVTGHSSQIKVVDQHPKDEPILTSVLEVLTNLSQQDDWLAPTIKGKR